jgi:hypothetical protein
MMAYPAYWEEVAKRMYADGEDRALKIAVTFAGWAPNQVIDSITVYGNWPWFHDQWRARYWFAKDKSGRLLIPEDLR